MHTPQYNTVTHDCCIPTSRVACRTTRWGRVARHTARWGGVAWSTSRRRVVLGRGRKGVCNKKLHRGGLVFQNSEQKHVIFINTRNASGYCSQILQLHTVSTRSTRLQHPSPFRGEGRRNQEHLQGSQGQDTPLQGLRELEEQIGQTRHCCKDQPEPCPVARMCMRVSDTIKSC